MIFKRGEKWKIEYTNYNTLDKIYELFDHMSIDKEVSEYEKKYAMYHKRYWKFIDIISEKNE